MPRSTGCREHPRYRRARRARSLPCARAPPGVRRDRVHRGARDRATVQRAWNRFQSTAPASPIKYPIAAVTSTSTIARPIENGSTTNAGFRKCIQKMKSINGWPQPAATMIAQRRCHPPSRAPSTNPLFCGPRYVVVALAQPSSASMFPTAIGLPPGTRYLLLPWIPHNLDLSQTAAFHFPLFEQPGDLHCVLMVSRTRYRTAAPDPAETTATMIPPSALTVTTTSGGARQTVRRTKPTSAMPKSPGVLTELVQTGL